MVRIEPANIPERFCRLLELGCIEQSHICRTGDGFYAVVKPLSDILAHQGILSLPGEEGREMMCSLFFDDWYLYAVPHGDGSVYSLFKMREQEQDEKLGLFADGDIPGVTISFIAMDTERLLLCLRNPTEDGKRQLCREIDRVVARGGQTHHPALKEYFLRTESRGAYRIAGLYTKYIASFARDGVLPVPECYETLREKEGMEGRLPRFLEENNRRAGRVVCDHRNLHIRDAAHLTEEEALAILATHTGNVSFHSFAAEVQYHARFLTRWAKIPLPLIGHSPYASAIRADMSIGDAEFTGPTPYYRLNSSLVRRQYACHRDAQYDMD